MSASHIVRAQDAERYAVRKNTEAAWIVAADAWEEAGEEKRARLMNALRPSSLRHAPKEFLQGVIDAFWLPAWASWMEENGGELPRNITRETAPRAPEEITRHARNFIQLLRARNRGVKLWNLVQRAALADGVPVSAEELGYDLAMQGSGHGVSWVDSHSSFPVTIPSLIEIHAYPRSLGRWGADGYVSDRFVTELR